METYSHIFCHRLNVQAMTQDKAQQLANQNKAQPQQQTQQQQQAVMMQQQALQQHQQQQQQHAMQQIQFQQGQQQQLQPKPMMSKFTSNFIYLLVTVMFQQCKPCKDCNNSSCKFRVIGPSCQSFPCQHSKMRSKCNRLCNRQFRAGCLKGFRYSQT